ncbi:ATP-dependent nuclease [Peptoniphilaceae bacterium SGI.131]
MKIVSFEINNYRSYKNSDNQIEINKDISVLVGQNNVGKTNILRAIFLFFNPNLYNPIIDRNYIKKITGGASKDPKIKMTIIDDITFKDQIQSLKYTINCDLNSSEKDYYSVNITDKNIVNNKLNTSGKIKSFLEKNFKIIFLSTTDEDFTIQSRNLINRMILEYFKSKKSVVKTTIKDFEKAYDSLIDTFSTNLGDIEEELGQDFKLLNDAGMEIKPKLIIDETETLTQFLQQRIVLKLDDSYEQEISQKGAGIQRTSLIILSYFLLEALYPKYSKIMLIDEPEAYLYPLLVESIKQKIQDFSFRDMNSNTIITTHSSVFLREINNKNYNFYNIKQNLEEKTYKRSINDIDINKYSVISMFNKRTKYEVLKNYGLLYSIDNYEDIIICEGKTDCNYLIEIIKGQEFYPQIRYGSYSYDSSINNEEKDFNYDYVGRGANAILNILAFLDNISPIYRNVFILLDGDKEGKDVAKKIKPNEYSNLNIKVHNIDEDMVVEDKVFSRSNFIKYIIESFEEIDDKELNNFYSASGNLEKSVVEVLRKYLEAYNPGVDINKIKHKLSVNLENKVVEGDWILTELISFFKEEIA